MLVLLEIKFGRIVLTIYGRNREILFRVLPGVTAKPCRETASIILAYERHNRVWHPLFAEASYL